MPLKSAIFSPAAMTGKLRNLVISMVLLLLLFPFLQEGTIQRIIANILNSAILFFGVYAVSFRRRNLIIALALGVPWVALSWLEIVAIPNILSPLSFILVSFSSSFYILFMGFTAIVILLYVLKSERVDEEVLYGAAAVYMLAGGTFFAIYVFIELLLPGSFMHAALGPDVTVEWPALLYYSYTTLTTLGYGDIIPVSAQARSFAVLEAIIGVMYLAVIISRLIGMYITGSRSEQSG